jgi:hypothetical protein
MHEHLSPPQEFAPINIQPLDLDRHINEVFHPFADIENLPVPIEGFSFNHQIDLIVAPVKLAGATGTLSVSTEIEITPQLVAAQEASFTMVGGEQVLAYRFDPRNRLVAVPLTLRLSFVARNTQELEILRAHRLMISHKQIEVGSLDCAGHDEAYYVQGSYAEQTIADDGEIELVASSIEDRLKRTVLLAFDTTQLSELSFSLIYEPETDQIDIED